LGQRKVALLIAVTADLTAKIKAGHIIKNIAPIVPGGEVPRNQGFTAG
jgi:alanyl-tRNA synthetase